MAEKIAALTGFTGELRQRREVMSLQRCAFLALGEGNRPAQLRLGLLELVEPSLGWMQLDQETRERQQREFVLAVESALDRFGLGPLSHRRP